ncbi:ribosomal protein l19 protein [Cystoisospora suis]|uniref:50S ribosomal protein L19, chloroplastic n=1 Tax=Cystoisospora suis TaxID=483139 RepID=A0A2C6KLJ3_9APIC|nr:ribosomal protein l19 protein [Cystoisospora suis]
MRRMKRVVYHPLFLDLPAYLTTSLSLPPSRIPRHPLSSSSSLSAQGCSFSSCFRDSPGNAEEKEELLRKRIRREVKEEREFSGPRKRGEEQIVKLRYAASGEVSSLIDHAIHTRETQRERDRRGREAEGEQSIDLRETIDSSSPFIDSRGISRPRLLKTSPLSFTSSSSLSSPLTSSSLSPLPLSSSCLSLSLLSSACSSTSSSSPVHFRFFSSSPSPSLFCSSSSSSSLHLLSPRLDSKEICPSSLPLPSFSAALFKSKQSLCLSYLANSPSFSKSLSLALQENFHSQSSSSSSLSRLSSSPSIRRISSSSSIKRLSSSPSSPPVSSSDSSSSVLFSSPLFLSHSLFSKDRPILFPPLCSSFSFSSSSLSFLYLSIRSLRQRVLPSNLRQRLFHLDNPETSRFWPPVLYKKEEEEVRKRMQKSSLFSSSPHPTHSRPLHSLHHYDEEEEEEKKRKKIDTSSSSSILPVDPLLHYPPLCLPRGSVLQEKLLEEEKIRQVYIHRKREEEDYHSLHKRNAWSGPPIADTPASRLEPLMPKTCRELIHQLHLLEIHRLEKERNFQLPLLGPGDLLEVRYELSRSQQTFATFQGYCVGVRKKKLNSSFVVRNAYEGIGVEQRIPLHSPRILSIKVVNSCASATQDYLLNPPKPLTRDYRYKWKYNFKGRWTKRIGAHKPGIRTVEKKIRQRIVRIRKRYMGQRIEAGLPPYVWGGPYPMFSKKRSLFIRGEMYRRMLIYSFDERRRRAEKLRKRRAKVQWGRFKLRQLSTEASPPAALTTLPSYHPLYPGNLPK